MADTHDLAARYAAKAQHLRYAIGVLDTPEHSQVPVIRLYQPDWDRELLAVVRSSLAEGLELAFKPAADATVELRLSTRQRIEVQLNRDGQTVALRAPAWDAQLIGVARDVAGRFDAACRGAGAYTLVIRTSGWACAVRVTYPSGDTHLGEIMPAEDPPPEAVSQI
jgi:hypothetical protein